LQAVSKRQEHRTDQYEGHRRAFEDACQHDLSVPRPLFRAVMQITNPSGRLFEKKSGRITGWRPKGLDRAGSGERW
jgi:hypothetical protein